MILNGNTILITGGATGIGYAMAKFFQERDNTVVICGRREERLKQAAKEIPGIYTFVCDVSDLLGRGNLFQFINKEFPHTNMLINNAGVQRDIDLTRGMNDFNRGDNEIRINFEAPVLLSALFTPFLTGKENAAIINVSSGLAFIPERASGVPVYAATKAALHAFTVGQRMQLAPLGIRVIEIIPPAVQSELNLEGRTRRGIVKSPHMPTSEAFVANVMAQMEQDIEEIRIPRDSS